MAQRRRNPRQIDPQLLRVLIRTGDGAPSLEEKLELLQRLRSTPESSAEVDRFLVERVERYVQGLEEAQAYQREIRELVNSLVGDPWYPATLLQVVQIGDRPRAVVMHGGTLRVVGVSEEVDARDLGVGEEVFLSKELNAVVGQSPDGAPRCGETAIFERLDQHRLVLKHRDDEFVVNPAASLDADNLRAGDMVRWDRTSLLAFEKIERSQGKHLFLEHTPQETFACIGGLDNQIAEIQETILLRLQDPDFARQWGRNADRGILLVGPPGTGKTLLARAFCNWLATLSPSGRARFMHIKPGELHSEWYSVSERNYREAFRVAREAAAENNDIPVVLFFDEIDSVIPARGTSHMRVDDRVVTTLATELEGLEERGNILVLAASNRPDVLDTALVRAGRLGDLVIDVPRPNRNAAREIFARHLPESGSYEATDSGLEGTEARENIIESVTSHMYSPNGDFGLATLVFRDGTHRALKTEDLVSGADIANIVNKAIRRVFRRKASTGDATLRLDDILTAADKQRETIVSMLTPANCRRYLSSLPDDTDVVRIAPFERKVTRPHAYLNAA